MACPSRWLVVSLTACSVALAGCGSGKRAAPHLPPTLAQRLAHQADAVARADGARLRKRASRLQLDVIDAINLGVVPAALQEELQGRANELVDSPGRRRARAFAAWLRQNSG